MNLNITKSWTTKQYVSPDNYRKYTSNTYEVILPNDNNNLIKPLCLLSNYRKYGIWRRYYMTPTDQPNPICWKFKEKIN